MTDILVRHDGDYTIYEFLAGGYEFQVFQSPRSKMWNVYRKPKGYQRNIFGKSFHDAAAMVNHYKTAKAVLRNLVNPLEQVVALADDELQRNL